MFGQLRAQAQALPLPVPTAVSIAVGVIGTFVGGLVAGGLWIRFKRSRIHVKHQNLTGKVVIVTGGNRGIGKETVRSLAEFGATVIIACREPGKYDQLAKELSKEVTCWQLDLASFKSVRAFAQKFIESGNPLHILICNAGVTSGERSVTEDGNERTLQLLVDNMRRSLEGLSNPQTNHLSHFLLTALLLPVLTSSGTKESPSRVLSLSSELHRYGRIVIDDLNYKNRPWVADQVFTLDGQYGNTKLMSILFAGEMQRRLKDRNLPIVAFSLTPGLVNTELALSLPPIHRWLNRILFPLGYVKTPQQGALTSVHVATAPEVLQNAGAYFADCAVQIPVRSEAKDDALANGLWAATETLVGQKLL